MGAIMSFGVPDSAQIFEKRLCIQTDSLNQFDHAPQDLETSMQLWFLLPKNVINKSK
jgi:hypothetical protein